VSRRSRLRATCTQRRNMSVGADGPPEEKMRSVKEVVYCTLMQRKGGRKRGWGFRASKQV
jgi:hypothetical protein